MALMDGKHELSPAEELRARYGARRALAYKYGRRARLVILTKRVYLASIIGYAVFDPTVAAVLLPMAISLLPVVLVQHYFAVRWARNRRSTSYYARALERLGLHWVERGDQGQRYAKKDHSYASDLDLFGRGSLFQLLCVPSTAQGRDTLARWLTSPADASTIVRRQDAVRELRDQLDTREELDAAGARNPPVDTASLVASSQARPIVSNRWSRFMLTVAAWLWLVMFAIGLERGGACWTIFLWGLLIQTIGYVVLRRRILDVASRGYQIGSSLIAMSDYARVVGAASWNGSLARELVDTIRQPPRPMHRFVAAAVGLLAQLPAAYFLAVQLVPTMESRLLKRLRHLPTFWNAIGQCEVLAAFAAHAYQHPSDCFPELVEPGPCFDAKQLGHPLIAERGSVANDVKLDAHLQLLMVSGSNMSGKSTLLRTVGTNAALALAGATVRAHSLRISPLTIGTAMRFQDSLEEGASYFYSVLSRLRSVLDLLDEDRPLLFLLDEILQGTNSHDRLAGAEAVVHKLLRSGAIGLVTTHDLELTQVADHLSPAAANVHFVDTVIDGQLHFDYRMHEGVVQSSNAIRLMRDMGLDV